MCVDLKTQIQTVLARRMIGKCSDILLQIAHRKGNKCINGNGKKNS